MPYIKKKKYVRKGEIKREGQDMILLCTVQYSTVQYSIV